MDDAVEPRFTEADAHALIAEAHGAPRMRDDDIEALIEASQGPRRSDTFDFDACLEVARGGGIRRTAGVLRADVANRAAQPWLIKGVLAPGWIVKVAAPPKCGKGELVAHIIAALEHGKPSVFDSPDWQPDTTYTTLIVTEEPDSLFAQKLEHHDVRKAGVIFDYELEEAAPRWKDAVQVICAEAVAGGHSIIFLDNISALTKCDDEAGVQLAGYLKTLKVAARQHNLTVIVDHHHRKAGGAMSDKSRGSTSINGLFDNNIDLYDPAPDDADNTVRKVYSKGRGDGTRWTAKIALLDDKSGYRRADTGEAVQLTAEQAALRDEVAELGQATLTDLGATTREERRNMTKRLETLTKKGVLERNDDGWTVTGTTTEPAI
jgi:AAA domain-containing protein